MLSYRYLWHGRGHYLGNSLGHYPTHKSPAHNPRVLRVLKKMVTFHITNSYFDLMQESSRCPLQVYVREREKSGVCFPKLWLLCFALFFLCCKVGHCFHQKWGSWRGRIQGGVSKAEDFMYLLTLAPWCSFAHSFLPSFFQLVLFVFFLCWDR
jgi:hypothetical protein